MIVAGIVAKFGVGGLAVVTLMGDGMTGARHNSNVELMAQGIANIFSPMFGGMPATGAIARTATNVRSGAKSPVAGIVHALTLMVILLAAAPVARFIPLGDAGHQNILPHVDAALTRAKEVYEDFGGVGGEFAKDMSGTPV